MDSSILRCKWTKGRMMKVCVTGGTRGLGKTIAAFFRIKNYDVKIFDRSHNVKTIIDESIGCDIFVNNSYGDGMQLELLDTLHNKVGKMIVCGSIAADNADPRMPEYSDNKKKLQEKFYFLTQEKNKKIADMLLLKLTSSSYSNNKLIRDSIDFWLDHPEVIEFRFD